MITAVAFCPEAPALVPDVGRGLEAELGEVRAACRAVVARAAAVANRIVVVGGAEVTRRHEPNARGSFRGFGVALTVPLGSDDPGPTELPPSLTTGAWLLRDALGPDNGASGRSVGTDSVGVTFPSDPTALLVMGDGTARRSEKAPGSLDPRAAEHDRRTAEALGSGASDALHTDPDLGHHLLVAGARAWNAVAGQLGPQSWSADLLYAGAPFGVGYFVALWTR